MKELEEKTTQLKWGEETRLIRQCVENASDAIFWVDNKANFIYVNKAACRHLGYSREELLLKKVHDVDPLYQKENWSEFWRDFKDKGSLLFESINRTREGKDVPVEIAVNYLKYEGREIMHAYVRDITERKKSELERQKMETKVLAHAKLASLGEIATGIAHEINQPLSYIRVIYEAAINDLEKGEINQEEMRVEFHEALYQVARISRIIDHLRTFGRSDSKEFNNVNMGTVLENALTLMGEGIRLGNITLKQHIAADLKDILGNSCQLEQIFVNLFQNSLYALKSREGGIINVSISNEKDKVVVYFSDNGAGVPKELLDKVFEPFFTTKEVGKGTGLGLSIVYGIVDDHNGIISCESEPNQGTTFVISFPQSGKS